MDNNTIDILKIIIPAISSLIGAIIAGGIAIYSSNISLKRQKEINFQTLKLSSFSMTISDSYQKIMEIIITALQENRLLNNSEKKIITQRYIWINKDVVDVIKLLLICQTQDEFKSNADKVIDLIRSVIGTD